MVFHVPPVQQDTTVTHDDHCAQKKILHPKEEVQNHTDIPKENWTSKRHESNAVANLAAIGT